MPRQSSALIAFHGNVTTTMQERKISLGYPAVGRIWHFAFAFALLKFLDPLLPFSFPHLLLLAFLNTPVRHQKSWYFPFCIISLACPFWWPPTESLSRFLARSLSLLLSIYVFLSLSFFLLLAFFLFLYPSFLSTLALLLSNLKPKSAKSFSCGFGSFQIPWPSLLSLPSFDSATCPCFPLSASTIIGIFYGFISSEGKAQARRGPKS